MKLFRFIWEYFRAKDPEDMKKALYWLQVCMSNPINVYITSIYSGLVVEKLQQLLIYHFIISFSAFPVATKYF